MRGGVFFEFFAFEVPDEEDGGVRSAEERGWMVGVRDKGFFTLPRTRLSVATRVSIEIAGIARAGSCTYVICEPVILQGVDILYRHYVLRSVHCFVRRLRMVTYTGYRSLQRTISICRALYDLLLRKGDSQLR